MLKTLDLDLDLDSGMLKTQGLVIFILVKAY